MSEILTRDQVKEENKWDLSSLYQSEEEFLKDVEILKNKTAEAPSYSGIMDNSKEDLLKVLSWYYDSLFVEECIGSYAFLNYSTDVADSQATKRLGTISQICTAFDASVSYLVPEILACKNVEKWIEEEEFADYKIAVKKMLRFKDHTLVPEQEKLLALESDVAQVPSDTFSALTNGDMKFESVDGQPLTQSSYTTFLHSKDRSVREKAYKNFYASFEGLKSTIANLYYGSVKQDLFSSSVHGYKNALDAALFVDDVDESVYMNLINTVHEAFPLLHRFYEIKRKALGLEKLAHYDVYVPLVDSVEFNTPYEEGVKIILEALKPLGEEYTSIIKKGLTTDRWADKYENKGKRSGAFSAGGYKGNPFLLVNYKEDVLDSVFTLAHEGGHSMHSYYSAKNNPFPCYSYVIFQAEVASTFNEQLVAKYLMDTVKTKEEKAYLIAKQLDDMIATLFRQTMFAEFELKCHQLVENGQPLTIETLRSTYRGLLENYFGPDVELLDVSDLEGIRIPHFYRAYYVYKYSTGICASIALSEKVLNGGKKELDDYLGFLKSGGTMFPIESLKEAGVDMSTPEPIRAAINKFEKLMDEFEELTK